jgi:hypothetical protein
MPALAQPAADAQQTWRLGGPRSVTPAGPGQVKEVSGILVSDPAERAIRLDADDRDVFRVPYDRIVAMHYERAAYLRRFLRRSSFYLVVHYMDAAGNPASETIRILSERDALAAVDTFPQHTGRGVERSVTWESFLGIPIRARVGTRVAVTDAAGEAVKGTIAELSSSSLTLSQSDGDDRVFDAKDVHRIRLLVDDRLPLIGVRRIEIVTRRVRSGAVRAGIGGSLLGFAIGAARGPSADVGAAGHALAAGAWGTGLGALTGMVLNITTPPRILH